MKVLSTSLSVAVARVGSVVSLKPVFELLLVFVLVVKAVCACPGELWRLNCCLMASGTLLALAIIACGQIMLCGGVVLPQSEAGGG